VNREQLESQLSAMYDGELPAAECELLARRLVREEPLRATWSRYAVIGAALRSEPVARVRPDFARRVSERLVEATGEQGASGTRRRGGLLLRRAGLGAGIAAGVAGAALLLLRHGVDFGGGAGGPAQGNALVASAATGTASPSTAAPGNDGVPAVLPSLRAGRGTYSSLDMHASNEPASYVVPPAAPANGLAVPVALADYVLAHSEVSSPLVRRSLISSLVASDALEPAVAAGPRSGAAPQGVVGQGVVDRGVADKGAATGVPSGGPQR
jgi:hypothetical protein